MCGICGELTFEAGSVVRAETLAAMRDRLEHRGPDDQGLFVSPAGRAGLGFRRAAGVALASDTVSITTMEIIDNAFILIVPGALAAGLDDALFWWSLALSLAIAFVLTVPVNRWLIARGRGHAVMHELHAH